MENIIMKENYYLEKVNRYCVYRADNSGHHKDKFYLYFSSPNEDTCKKIQKEINTKYYISKIIDQKKETYIERLYY